MIRLRPRLVAAVAAVVCVAGAPAFAGEGDTHMAGTHYIARTVPGFSEHDAAMLARANFSLDWTLKGTALPLVDPNQGKLKAVFDHVVGAAYWSKDPAAQERYLWWARGTINHSFGSSREEVKQNLDLLRNKIPILRPGQTETPSQREWRMIALGQYLHALQDVYFHQAERKPLEPFVGHLLTGLKQRVGGEADHIDLHEADKVNLHFDAAVLAFDETKKALASVARGDPPPDIDWDLAYADPETRVPQVAKRVDPEMVHLASAIARSYDSFEEDEPDKQIPRVLEEQLQELWLKQGHDGGYVPFVQFGHGERALLDYDKYPNLLLFDATMLEGLLRKLAGGISFTEAAALGLPLRLDIDGVMVDKGRIVLSGKSANELQQFDAAQLMTAFRLACGHGDPYFSLDPVDGKQWVAEGDTVLQAARNELRESALAAPYAATDGYWLVGPAQFTQRVREVQSPTLHSKLVFSPGWLRETRFGKVLYDADVLLKLMAGGAPLPDGGGFARAPALPGYHSAEERVAVGGMRALVDGGTPPPIGGNRLWFELGEQRSRELFPSFAPPDLRMFMDTGFSAPRDGRAILREQMSARLSEAGLVDFSQVDEVRTSPQAAQLVIDGGAMDLAAVWPRMFVRRHDAASGQDLPGESPGLQAVANDVNSRPQEWMLQYPELQALVGALRVYVAAVKITAQQPEVCRQIARLPLMPSERLGSPLPATRPAILSMSSLSFRSPGYPLDEASARAISSDDLFDPSTPGDLAASGSSTLQGGVSLGVKSGSAVLTDVRSRTATTEALLRAQEGLTRSGESLVLSLAWDLPERAASLPHFVHITEADVLGTRPWIDTGSAAREWKRRAARVVGDPLVGSVVVIQLLGIAMYTLYALLALPFRGRHA